MNSSNAWISYPMIYESGGGATRHLSLAAQEMGNQKWYEHYELRVAEVERAYAKPST
jgi:hypothetical protein